MKNWMQIGAASLVIGIIFTVSVMHFSQFDFLNTVKGPMHYLIFQSISLSTTFFASYLLMKFIKDAYRTKHHLTIVVTAALACPAIDGNFCPLISENLAG